MVGEGYQRSVLNINKVIIFTADIHSKKILIIEVKIISFFQDNGSQDLLKILLIEREERIGHSELFSWDDEVDLEVGPI